MSKNESVEIDGKQYRASDKCMTQADVWDERGLAYESTKPYYWNEYRRRVCKLTAADLVDGASFYVILMAKDADGVWDYERDEFGHDRVVSVELDELFRLEEVVS